MIKAEDLARSRRIIPDIGVWHQCYMLWLSVALKVDLGRCQELLAYGYLITKCSNHRGCCMTRNSAKAGWETGRPGGTR